MNRREKLEYELRLAEEERRRQDKLEEEKRRKVERAEYQERLERLEQQKASREEELQIAQRREHTIDRLPPYKERSEVDLFVESFEAELLQAGIPEDEWKKILISKLPPKTRHHISEVAHKVNSAYNDVKTILFQAAGQTLLEIGMKLLERRPENSKSTRDWVKSLFILADHVFIDCTSKSEMIRRLVCALTRASLSIDDQRLLDARNVVTCFSQ